MIRWNWVFSGYVQGVGFRYDLSARARKLGITGWVRNLPDGNVEAEAQGLPEHLAELADYLRSRYEIADFRQEPRPVRDERGFKTEYY